MNGFVQMSKYAGMREDLVQAGGGNSSVKLSENKMAVKASGVQMSELTDQYGYSIVDSSIIRDYFLDKGKRKGLTEKDGAEILQKSLIEGMKPSIETFLHATLNKYTLHTHPIVVNALVCRSDWENEVKALFPLATTIPYASPGVDLAKEYYERIGNTSGDETVVVFLKNHGLVISGNTAEEVIAETEKVVRKIEEYLHVDMEDYHASTDIWKVYPGKVAWKVKDNDVIDYYQENGIWNYAFCPDCVVFLGMKVKEIDSDLGLEVPEYSNNEEPVLITKKNALYVLADNLKKAREIESVLSFSAQVSKMNKNISCDFLSTDEQLHLLHRDDEKYRKMMK